MKGRSIMKKFVVNKAKTNNTFTGDSIGSGENKTQHRLRRPVEHVKPKDAEEKSEKPELSEKEIDSLKELAKLLPELKKLLESKPEEEPEDEDEGDDEGDEVGDEDEAIEEDDVIIEEEQEDDQPIDEEEEEEEEEEVEDTCGGSAHDSLASIGSIEAKNTTDSVLAHEQEVASAFDSRYKKSLRK